MKNTNNRYAGQRYPIGVINHAIWLYNRFTLSFQLKVAVETAYLCTYSKEPKKLILKKKSKKRKKIISHISRRNHERYNVGDFPVEVKKPDGTKLNAVLCDISYRGFQILCSGLTARIFSKETGLLTDDDTNEVEITIKIKSRK